MHYDCVSAFCYSGGSTGNRQRWRWYCHDGSGYCTEPELISCNC